MAQHINPSIPRYCVLELTRQCNLNCSHCGTSAGEKRADELTFDEYLSVLDQLSELGTVGITLSGGEPTLRDDWPAIALAAQELGIGVNMVTNGQCDPIHFSQTALLSGLKNVTVSLDGMLEIHDRLRKPGAFERASRTIRNLRKARIGVGVIMTVNKLNLDQVALVYDYARELDVRDFRAQLAKPMGNMTHEKDLVLDGNEVVDLISTLAQLSQKPGPTVDAGDSIGYFTEEEKKFSRFLRMGTPWKGCQAGLSVLGIHSDGSVKGCLSLQPRSGEADPFIEGNIRTESLRDIWNNEANFVYNRQFTKRNLRKTCSKCVYGPLCRGGANCVSYSMTGNFGYHPLCAQRHSVKTIKKRSWTTAASTMAALVALGTSSCSSQTPFRESDAEDSESTECSEVDCECVQCEEVGNYCCPGGRNYHDCMPCGDTSLEAFQRCCCSTVDCTPADPDPCDGDHCPPYEYGDCRFSGTPCFDSIQKICECDE